MKTPEELLSALIPFQEGYFPEDVLAEIITRRDEMVEPLLQAFGDLCEDPETFMDDDSFYPIYLVYLLAQFRVERAFRPLVELLGRDEDTSDTIFGDVVTDGMAGILASVFDGDQRVLHELVENPRAGEYTRAAALESLALLAQIGKIPKLDVETYFGELFGGSLEREHNMVWNNLCMFCGYLRFTGLLPDVERAFQDGLCDPMFVPLQDIVGDMQAKKDRELDGSLVEDTINELNWWDAFKTPRTRQAAPRPAPGIVTARPAAPTAGRNDPCPCGSGKKFKKCCGNEARILDDQRQTEAKASACPLRVRITLAGTDPEVWRELVVPGSFTLDSLHKAIQAVMPWDNNHMHQFEHADTVYADPVMRGSRSVYQDPRQQHLHAFAGHPEPLVYCYDFGDDWCHLVEVSRAEDLPDYDGQPCCVAGENACPPEDCGGIPGYHHMLRNQQLPEGERDEELIDWHGEFLDPTAFDKDQAGEFLAAAFRGRSPA